MDDAVYQLFYTFGAVIILFALTAAIFAVDFILYKLTKFSLFVWIEKHLFK